MKISKEMKENFQGQVTGLTTLMRCADYFAKLGNVADVIVVVATSFAFNEDYNLPKLFVPFDFEMEELDEYLETGVVPKRYQEREKEKERELEMMGLGDDFFDDYVGAFEDTGEEGFDEKCGDVNEEED